MDLEQKQLYLCEEIRDKDFDGEEFFLFLQKKTGKQEPNIIDVEFSNLKKIVEEFQENQLQQKQIIKEKHEEVYENLNNEIKPAIDQDSVSSSTKEFNFKKAEKVLDYIDHHIDLKLSCNKINKTNLINYKEIKFTIDNPQLIKGGVFSSSYITYTLKCEILKSEVSRRYSDFEWYRIELKKLFPNYYVKF